MRSGAVVQPFPLVHSMLHTIATRKRRQKEANRVMCINVLSTINSQIHCNLFKVSPASFSTQTHTHWHTLAHAHIHTCAHTQAFMASKKEHYIAPRTLMLIRTIQRVCFMLSTTPIYFQFGYYMLEFY